MLISLAIGLPLNCFAQTKTTEVAHDTLRRPLLCITLKGYFGHLSGGNLSVATIIHRRHELGIGYEGYLQKARNMPPDFFCSTCKHGPDKDWIAGGTFTYGYAVYPRFLRRFARVILRTGILAGNQSIPDNFRRIPNAPSIGNNYTYGYDRHFTLAWIINPSIDIEVGRLVGVTIGPYGVVNGDFLGGGISLGAMLTPVREHRPTIVPPGEKPVE